MQLLTSDTEGRCRRGVVLISSHSTGVAACIPSADWGQDQSVTPAVGGAGGDIPGPQVPDVGVVVTQGAGGAAGQCDVLSLVYCIGSN